MADRRSGLRVVKEDTGYCVCFCGDVATGKTTLVKAVINQGRDEIYRPTIVAECSADEIRLDSGELKNIVFWDLSGNVNYRECTPVYFRQSKLTVVVFDLTRASSFDSVEGWVQLASDSVGDREVPFILVGNKCDLESERVVQTNEGEELGKKTNALAYIETSAKENIQIDILRHVIEEQAKEFFKNVKEMPPVPPRGDGRRCQC